MLAPSLEAACRRWADRPAVTYRGRTTSYRELWNQVVALACAYRDLGVEPGDRVVCQLPNSPQHLVAMNAAWRCGAVHVGTDADLTGRELASLVERTGAAALVFRPRAGSPDPLAPLDEVRARCPRTRILLDGAEPGHPADLPLSELLHARPRRPPSGRGLHPSDAALLHLTSGTTGKPKAVVESLEHCWAKMQFFADAYRPGPDDVALLYLPMGHVFGMRLAMIPVLRGGRLVLADRFSPDDALRLVAEEGVTVLPGIATHFTLLLGALDPQRHDVASLRWAISAAAALPRPLVGQIYDTLGVELLYVYGCSEGFTTQTTDRAEIEAGSVGRWVFRGPPGTPPDGTVAILAPAEQRFLPPGEVGEIAFGAACPVRYWDDPPVATDGWYRTGDLGRIDSEGRVYILGRLKELVNRGGLKVAPTEVETLLARHPRVADAAVVGTPDPVLGEAICACIVARGDPPDLTQVRSFLADSVARHKLPDELCLVPHVPRTKIGKVDRAVLTATLLEENLPRERLRAR